LSAPLAVTEHSPRHWYVRREMAALLPPPPAFDDQVALDDLAARLGWYRHGRRDPTTRIGPTGMLRAMWTPDGPASIAVSWATGALEFDAWGPGAPSAVEAAHRMAALDRRPPAVPDLHPVVTAAARRFPGLWAGASGDLYHTLLPTILAQRITSGEAIRQWMRLCSELGERPPGPDLGLVLPPHPERLAGRPTWWFHPLGIEGKRARTLTEVARVAHRLWDWARLPVADVAAKLRLVAGTTTPSRSATITCRAWCRGISPASRGVLTIVCSSSSNHSAASAAACSVCSSGRDADRPPSARAAASSPCTAGDRAGNDSCGNVRDDGRGRGRPRW
jgi:hypothetical protein